MAALVDVIQNHSIRDLSTEIRAQIVAKRFGQWMNNTDDWFLSLYRFAERPLTYFNDDTVQAALDILEANPLATYNAIGECSSGISHALTSVTRRGQSWDYEQSLDLESPEGMISFQEIWHPEYLRYAEHIYSNIINVLLHVIGTERNRDYTRPALSNRVEFIEAEGLAVFTKGMNTTVRNSIAHGGFEYSMDAIDYKTRSTTETITAPSFANLFDDLVETCHAICVSVLCFVARNRHLWEEPTAQPLPIGIRWLIVDGISSRRGFSIDAMLLKKLGEDQELCLFCNSQTKSRIVHVYETLHSVYQSLRAGPGWFSHITVSIQCGEAVQSMAILDGDRFVEAIERRETMDESENIFKHGFFWHDTSSVHRHIHVFAASFALTWQRQLQELRRQWETAGIRLCRHRYEIKSMRNISSPDSARAEAQLLLLDSSDLDFDWLVKIVRHAIRKIRRKRLYIQGISERSRIAYKPKHVVLRMYGKDGRDRQLGRVGWADQRLLLMAEWHHRSIDPRSFRVRTPDFAEKALRMQLNRNVFTLDDENSEDSTG